MNQDNINENAKEALEASETTEFSENFEAPEMPEAVEELKIEDTFVPEQKAFGHKPDPDTIEAHESALEEEVIREETKADKIKYFITIGVVLGIIAGIVWQPENTEIGTKVLYGILIFGALGAAAGFIFSNFGGKKKTEEAQ